MPPLKLFSLLYDCRNPIASFEDSADAAEKLLERAKRFSGHLTEKNQRKKTLNITSTINSSEVGLC